MASDQRPVAITQRPVLMRVAVGDIVARGNLRDVDTPLARERGAKNRDPGIAKIDDLGS